MPLPPEPGRRFTPKKPAHVARLRRAVEGPHVCVGGTFSTIHRGHEYFLSMAFGLGGDVEIGLTSDSFASKKGHNVPPFEERKANLKNFLLEMGWDAAISEIDDEYGFALEDRFDTIVVSEETLPNAELINSRREGLGIEPLHVVAVPIIKSEGGEKIASSD